MSNRISGYRIPSMLIISFCLFKSKFQKSEGTVSVDAKLRLSRREHDDCLNYVSSYLRANRSRLLQALIRLVAIRKLREVTLTLTMPNFGKMLSRLTPPPLRQLELSKTCVAYDRPVSISADGFK